MLFLIRAAASAVLLVLLLGALLAAGTLAYLRPQLPDVRDLAHVQMQVPMRVVSAEGAVLGEFGEQRRIPVAYADIPPVLTQAILAAEDDRFFDHPGVDALSLVRAALAYARTGARRQGGSTITMQVARNFFLTPDKTLRRKALEILLALEIERTLSKQEIFALYVNRIFLGHRAYGFAAAAQVYYGRPLAEISLAQAATLAGLPKAPSRDNPFTNPARAEQRRNYVLRRMQSLGMVTPAQAQAAAAGPIVVVGRQRAEVGAGAPYVAEAARQWMVERFGDAAYAHGYVVHTTVRAGAQRAAQRAVSAALEDYDRRRGWRGALRRLPEATLADAAATNAALTALGAPGGQPAAAVTARRGLQVDLVLPGGRKLRLEGAALARAGQAAGVLKAGDVVRVRQREGAWELSQEPAVEGALVALLPETGAITSMVGGYDFARSSFNRALQADRQPGSAFKPFIYAAALAAGFTPASVVNDAPVVYRTDTVEGYWRPENYSREFYGPTRLREALAQSRNLVSIRLLEQIGVDFGRNYTLRFGFPARKIPQAISLALGTGAMTPLELAGGYAVFANGGYRVTPYLVERVQDGSGKVVYQAPVVQRCDLDCPPQQDGGAAARAIPATDAYLLYSMLQEVIRSGTGAAARALARPDLAGKTGTTNDSRDAWFAGFTPQLLAVTWVGFDQPRTLGKRETGGRAALPMWMDYMRAALAGVPVTVMPVPEGIVTLPVDRHTGARAGPGDPGSLVEVFDMRHLPPVSPAVAGYGTGGEAPVPADLF